MTRETLEDLRSFIRVGFTDKRGPAWWASSEHKDDGSHFTGAVPIEVARDLIGWEPVVGTSQGVFITNEGVTTLTDPNEKKYMNPRTGKIIGSVGIGHAVHAYEHTLLDTAQAIVDSSELGIGSVGMLGGGARAFVQYEFDETVNGGKDVEFRPFLTAATSVDGSLATTFFTGCQVVVCDNTLTAALGSTHTSYRLRHTRNSKVDVQAAREALSIAFQTADEFSAMVDKLTNEFVSDDKWVEFLKAYVPTPPEEGRSKTVAINKQGQLNALWKNDERVAPWKNSAWGVLAATNTWRNHFQTVRNVTRTERNMAKLIDGTFVKEDRETLRVLAAV
jgi:phage/plasmid-like protein (TIGR03299 family)